MGHLNGPGWGLLRWGRIWSPEVRWTRMESPGRGQYGVTCGELGWVILRGGALGWVTWVV